MHIENILNDMKKDDIDGYLLTGVSNIEYLTSYRLTSFAFCIITEEPVIYTSAMDMEIAEKTSKIKVKEFTSFTDMIKEIDFKNLAIEPDLPYSTYERLRDDFNITSKTYAEKQRQIKTPEEIANIEKATEIAQNALRQLDFEDKNENTAAFDLLRLMIENGASGESFETIVTSGANSSLPHAVPQNKIIEQPLLIDWGAKYNGYCSDNTRTFVYTEKQHEIFDIVAQAHDKAVKKIKPGIKCCEIDKIARDIINDYGYGDNFIHSTGHSLGLDIHETPGFSARDDTVIEKGMVMTVEPGIYLEGNFGIRLEDTVAVENNARIIGDLPLIF